MYLTSLHILLNYRNHVINFVLTNPFSISGIDNVQNICCNAKGNKEHLSSALTCEDFISIDWW
jgi:hypothetical protein